MFSLYYFLYLFVFVDGFAFVAGSAGDRASGDLENKKIVISMPPVDTTYADQYICYAKSLEEIGDSFVLSSVTNVDRSLVHHVATGVCEHPVSTETTWDCSHQQGSLCDGDAVNFGGWDEFNKKNGKFEFSNDVSLRVGPKTRLKYFIMEVHFMNQTANATVSAANVTLIFINHTTKFNYQTYAFLNNGLIPGNSGKEKILSYKLLTSDGKLSPDILEETGYFSEAACVWKRPPAFAYRYYLHTHHHGVLAEGYLIRNGIWTLIGSQLSMDKKKDLYDVPGGPIEIRPGDTLVARCLYINADEKPVKFGMSAGEEMCDFEINLGYDPQYAEQFRRPSTCRAISPDFRLCDHPETNQLC